MQNNTRLEMLMILIGQKIPEFIGNKKRSILQLQLQMLNLFTLTNFWVQKKDYVLLLLLIDVILLSLKLAVCFMVVHLQDPQELERLKV